MHRKGIYIIKKIGLSVMLVTLLTTVCFANDTIEPKIIMEQSNMVKGERTESNDKQIFTSTQVVEIALKNSKDVKGKEKDLDRASEVYEDTQIVLGTYIPSLIQAKKACEINQEWAEKNLATTKESIEDLVINSINNINILKLKMNVNDLKITNSKKELEMMKLKKDLGLESQYNYDNFKKEHEDLMKEHEKLKIDMKNSYVVLEEMFGLENIKQYDVQNKIAYNLLQEIDIDTLIRKELASNPNIWYLEKNVELKELAVKLHEYNKAGDSYAVKEIDVTKAEIDLDQAKTNLEYSMRVAYNQIKKIEEQHEQLQLKLQKLQNSLKTAKVNYDAGLIIELDVKKIEAGVKELEASIKELEMNHEKQVKYLHKPYLQQK
ncbi:MAG: hypothetical protein N4A64_13815 [Marinisporobacter sp.]|jgi:hypothetical protein|nr:hypothetical protein [Marinisporobacter sp.]